MTTLNDYPHTVTFRTSNNMCAEIACKTECEAIEQIVEASNQWNIYDIKINGEQVYISDDGKIISVTVE